MLKRASGGTRVRHLIGLVLILVLAACNLLTSNTPGGGSTTITGAPSVRLAAPLPNATFMQGVAINIQAQISNAGKDIDRVEIAADDQIIANLSAPNATGAPVFSVSHAWEPEGDGQHTISVTAFRADGSSSAPVTVNITIVAQGAQTKPTATASTAPGGGSQSSDGQGGGGNQAAPSATPQPTNTPGPTNTAEPQATETPSKPIATFNQGVNVRSGPSTKFNPPIGSMAAGQSVDVLGKTADGSWYKVRYYNAEGWVFGTLLTVSGDAAQIPVDNGPPVPTDTPIPPTPVPFTATPQTNVNLVAGNVRFDPGSPKCKETYNIYIDVANLGTQANTATGSLSVEDFAVRTGEKTQATTGPIPIIQPGQTVNVGPIPFTVSTFFNEKHRLVITLDPGGQVAETNEGDNQKTLEYDLAQGSC